VTPVNPPDWNLLQNMAIQYQQPNQALPAQNASQPVTQQYSSQNQQQFSPNQGYLMELASLTQGNSSMPAPKVENQQIMIDSQIQNGIPSNFMNEQWAQS
jgi:hypothetical protein